MQAPIIAPIALETTIETWPLVAPFRISGYTFDALKVVLVSLEHDGRVGRAEAAGVYYRGETVASLVEQVERVRRTIETGISRDSLQQVLPAGGARNAIDCAMWDLEVKLTGRPCWQIAELRSPQPLITTFTCGADTPDRMASAALAYEGARAIKLKLTGDPSDADRVRAVRQALPAAWLGVDANQGFSRRFLEELMPTLVQSRVELIEQPFRVGEEALLDGFRSPIPIAADESAQTMTDIAGLQGRFEVINIKLDKCGGLTGGLAMARAAHRLGMTSMVGNMMGTSLAMAPAFLVGQLCSVVDLDGPAFIRVDRPASVEYQDGLIRCPAGVWGE